MTIRSYLIRKLLYPLDRLRTGDYAEIKYFNDFEKKQFWPMRDVRAEQLLQLKKILTHSYASCPFYQSRFKSLGLRPTDLLELEDLHRFPILTKRDIQENRDSIVSTQVEKSMLIKNQTGGSTGEPVSFFLDKNRLQSRTAATRRHDRWAGLNVGDKVALIWGAPIDRPKWSLKGYFRSCLFGAPLYLDTACLSSVKFNSFNNELKRFRPKIIQAYSKSLALFAQYLDENKISAYQPESIITSAEMLSSQDRILIERVFGAPVFNRYGCREVSLIASECNQHNGLHIMAEGLYIEILQGDKLAQPGEVGRVIVTDLLNYAMPLIRYEIGDLAALDNSLCKCGRGLPRLKYIEGRSTEFIVGTDGRWVSGVFLATYLIAQRAQFGRLQLIQDNANQICIKICQPLVKEICQQDFDFLAAETKKLLGSDMQVSFEVSNEIPQTVSGKFQYCCSKLTQETSLDFKKLIRNTEKGFDD